VVIVRFNHAHEPRSRVMTEVLNTLGFSAVKDWGLYPRDPQHSHAKHVCAARALNQQEREPARGRTLRASYDLGLMACLVSAKHLMKWPMRRRLWHRSTVVRCNFFR
jgi:hypothetical protein